MIQNVHNIQNVQEGKRHQKKETFLSLSGWRNEWRERDRFSWWISMYLFYCTGGEMNDGRGNICIDLLVLDSFEQILARTHEG
jgi:hypothetical protein